MPLPDAPNLNWLRKQAKRRLDELRKTDPAARRPTRSSISLNARLFQLARSKRTSIP